MRAVVEGALAGTYAAAAMSILRMGAYRLGLVDRPVPHAIVDRLVGRTKRSQRSARAQVLASEWLHLLYGATWGALYGALAPKRQWIATGLVLAGAQWAVGSAARLPGFTEPRDRRPRELSAKAINVAGHLVHGLFTTLTTNELRRVVSERTLASPGERVG